MTPQSHTKRPRKLTSRGRHTRSLPRNFNRGKDASSRMGCIRMHHRPTAPDDSELQAIIHRTPAQLRPRHPSSIQVPRHKICTRTKRSCAITTVNERTSTDTYTWVTLDPTGRTKDNTKSNTIPTRIELGALPEIQARARPYRDTGTNRTTEDLGDDQLWPITTTDSRKTNC